jgi:GR25 family glycosyltransferase involved in LPS biosynthesis
VFLDKRHSHVIIAEDDMLFSQDFVAFFKQTAVLLQRDPSLWWERRSPHHRDSRVKGIEL